MIKIIKKNQSDKVKDLVPDKQGESFRYKSLRKILLLGEQVTEHSAMKAYYETDLRGTVNYLVKAKGMKIKRVKKRVNQGDKSYLVRWWELDKEAA